MAWLGVSFDERDIQLLLRLLYHKQHHTGEPTHTPSPTHAPLTIRTVTLPVSKLVVNCSCSRDTRFLAPFGSSHPVAVNVLRPTVTLLLPFPALCRSSTTELGAPCGRSTTLYWGAVELIVMVASRWFVVGASVVFVEA